MVLELQVREDRVHPEVFQAYILVCELNTDPTSFIVERPLILSLDNLLADAAVPLVKIISRDGLWQLELLLPFEAVAELVLPLDADQGPLHFPALLIVILTQAFLDLLGGRNLLDVGALVELILNELN